MATAYSSEVAVGTYNRIRLRVEYSGTSAHCYMEFRRTQAYSSSWADTQASITFNGATIAAPYSYTGTVGVDWVQLCNASGFSVSTSGGTYSWTFNNPGGSSVLGCSGTIYIPSQASIPSGGYINGVTSYWDNVTGEMMIHGTSAGVTNTGGSDLTALNIVITSSPYVSGTPRTEIAISNERQFTISDTINTRHDVAISPNSLYYTGLNATNVAGIYRYQGPSIVTVAAMATMSMETITSSSAQVNYSVPADGGYYTKTLEYSIDGGTTWVTGATISTGSASTGSFTITGLRAGTSYELKSRVVTTAGTTNNESVFFDIDGEGKLYGPAQMVGNLRIKGNTTQQTYTGKNLFDGVVESGEFSNSGNINANPNRIYSVNYIKVEPNTQYVANKQINRVCFYDTDKTFLNRSSSFNFYTFITPANSYFVRFDASTSIDISSFQLEQGSTATPYEPYVGGIPAPNPDYPQTVNTVTGEQTITITDNDSQTISYSVDLGSIELCKIGTYQDYIYKSGDDWYLHKETGKAILNGEEGDWSKSTAITAVNRYRTMTVPARALNSSTVYCMSSHEVGINSSDSDSGVLGVSARFANNGGLFFCTPIGTGNDTTSFETWLSNNNPTVYYALTTATDTKITNAALVAQLNALGDATTYGDGTTITADGQIPAEVTASLISARRVKKLYGSVSGLTKSTPTFYGSVSGEAVRVLP